MPRDSHSKHLLENFRTRYPQCALTADVVSLHEGQFVVRAAVTRQGELLASGLAASSDVQLAEDKARERALTVLGLWPEREQASSRPSAPVVPTASSPAQDIPPSDLSIEPEAVPVLPDDDDAGPPIDTVKETTLEPTAPTAGPSGQSALDPTTIEAFRKSANEMVDGAGMPVVDLSDIIAQTDIELKRLGWTSAQGRDYLEKTYGKRSRQQLSDEELMSFLLYLEEQ